MNKICSMVILLVTCLFFLLLTPFTQTTASVRPVGLIITVGGEVKVHSEKGAHPALEGYVLQEGDTIIVKIGARCSGFGLDGQTFSLSGPAQFVLTAAEKSGIHKIAAWIARQIAQWAGESRSKSLATRGIRDWQQTVQAPAPLIPANDGCVRASRSIFRWTMVEGIDSYTVSIASGEGEDLTYSVRGDKLILDNLQPGMNYLWQISAKTNGIQIKSVWNSFRVMEIEEENQLNDALSGLSDLQAGVVLLTVGLLEEAIYSFDIAVDSEVDHRSALRWRAKGFAAIGLHKEAYDDVIKTIER